MSILKSLSVTVNEFLVPQRLLGVDTIISSQGDVQEYTTLLEKGQKQGPADSLNLCLCLGSRDKKELREDAATGS